MWFNIIITTVLEELHTSRDSYRVSKAAWNSSRARPPWVLFSTQKWLARMEAVNKMVSLHYLFSVNCKIRTGEQVQFYISRWPL